MSPLGLAPKSVRAARSGCVNSDAATKSFQQLKRQRIRPAYLELNAITALVLAFLILAATLPYAALAAPFTWSSTGSMTAARTSHTATLLPSGKVLVAGGVNSTDGILNSAELYDLATGTWTPTGSMANPRNRHTATLLPNGMVLVAGGFNSSDAFLNSAELYDSAANGGAGAWSSTGSMTAARTSHTATLLPNGKVLVAGGYNGADLASTELYDPAANDGAGSWSLTGSMATPREQHTATLMPNGKVLVAGGVYSTDGFPNSAELYDPAANGGAGAWSPTDSMANARNWHTATLLPNGMVLVAGGINNIYQILYSAELYIAPFGSWGPTASFTTGPRRSHTATLLRNGQVLVVGGEGLTSYLSSAELLYYDGGAIAAWSLTGSMATPREQHTATLMPNGKVLVAGGFNATGVLNSAEFYNSQIFSPGFFELLLLN